MMYYMEEPSPSLSPSSSLSSSPSSSSSSSSWGYGGHPYSSSYYIGVVQGDPHTHKHQHPLEKVGRVVAESAVVIFSKSGCCMCHAVKRLLCGMGVNPRVYEIDQDPSGNDIEEALITLIGNFNNNNNNNSSSLSLSSPVPVVFIGGKLVGAMDRVMASHINGSLVPLLKEAGALWL